MMMTGEDAENGRKKKEETKTGDGTELNGK